MNRITRFAIVGSVVLSGALVGLSRSAAMTPAGQEDEYPIMETCTTGGYITFTSSASGTVWYNHGCEEAMNCSGFVVCGTGGCDGTLNQNPSQTEFYETAMVWTSYPRTVEIQSAGCQ